VQDGCDKGFSKNRQLCLGTGTADSRAGLGPVGMRTSRSVCVGEKKIACRVVEIHGTRKTNGGMGGATVIEEIVGFQNQAFGILQSSWAEMKRERAREERAPVPHRDDLKRLAAAQVYLRVYRVCPVHRFHLPRWINHPPKFIALETYYTAGALFPRATRSASTYSRTYQMRGR
jgi:hypothetical protein